MREPYIYGLQDPREPEVYHYIGQTGNLQVRMQSHLALKTQANREWIASLLAEGITPEMIILGRHQCETYSETLKIEKQYIDAYRQAGHPLLNKTLMDKSAFVSSGLQIRESYLRTLKYTAVKANVNLYELVDEILENFFYEQGIELLPEPSANEAA